MIDTRRVSKETASSAIVIEDGDTRPILVGLLEYWHGLVRIHHQDKNWEDAEKALAVFREISGALGVFDDRYNEGEILWNHTPESYRASYNTEDHEYERRAARTEEEKREGLYELLSGTSVVSVEQPRSIISELEGMDVHPVAAEVFKESSAEVVEESEGAIEYIGGRELQELLGIAKGTASTWIRSSELEYTKSGGTLTVLRSDLDALMAQPDFKPVRAYKKTAPAETPKASGRILISPPVLAPEPPKGRASTLVQINLLPRPETTFTPPPAPKLNYPPTIEGVSGTWVLDRAAEADAGKAEAEVKEARLFYLYSHKQKPYFMYSLTGGDLPEGTICDEYRKSGTGRWESMGVPGGNVGRAPYPGEGTE
jgi:hypothetical protein